MSQTEDAFDVPGWEYYEAPEVDLEEAADIEAEEARMRPEVLDPETEIAGLFDDVADALGCPKQDDIVVKPSHYTRWQIEPITYIMRNGMEFWRGNIIKYVSRAGAKLYDGMDGTQSEIADLKKVIRYAEMRINQLQGEVEL